MTSVLVSIEEVASSKIAQQKDGLFPAVFRRKFMLLLQINHGKKSFGDRLLFEIEL